MPRRLSWRNGMPIKLQAPVETTHVHSCRIAPVIFERRIVNHINDRTNNRRRVPGDTIQQRFQPSCDDTKNTHKVNVKGYLDSTTSFGSYQRCTRNANPNRSRRAPLRDELPADVPGSGPHVWWPERFLPWDCWRSSRSAVAWCALH